MTRPSERAYMAGVKLAKTRYEKEIEKGTINRTDVAPRHARNPRLTLWPENRPVPRKFTDRKRGSRHGMSRRVATREHLRAPAPVDAARARRLDRLAKLQYEQLVRNPPQVSAGKLQIRPMTGHPSYLIPQQFQYGMQPRPRGINVHTPSWGIPYGEHRRSLPIVQHEVGEALGTSRAMRYQPRPSDTNVLKQPGGWPKKIHPHASHLSEVPLLLEQLYAKGDPVAVRALEQIRARDTPVKMMGEVKTRPAVLADVIMHKYIRQAGGGTTTPMPLWGRKHRGLLKILNRGSIDPEYAEKLLTHRKEVGITADQVSNVLPRGTPQSASSHGGRSTSVIRNALKRIRL